LLFAQLLNLLLLALAVAHQCGQEDDHDKSANNER